MTNRMIWQKASFYLIWKCADWVASDMEPRCDQHSRGNWGHQLIKPSRVVKGKPPFFPVLFFYQDLLIIQLPLLMNTSLRARRKAIRRLCVGKSVKVCVYQTMLGTACDRLCPAHQGKTSYRCLVAYNRAEVGWGESCANAIHLRQASTGTISTSSHAWESLTAPFVPLVTWQFLNLIFSIRDTNCHWLWRHYCIVAAGQSRKNCQRKFSKKALTIISTHTRILSKLQALGLFEVAGRWYVMASGSLRFRPVLDVGNLAAFVGICGMEWMHYWEDVWVVGLH